MFIPYLYQVSLINGAIAQAKPGSRLYGLAHVSDPSDDVVEVLILCMEWNMNSRDTWLPGDTWLHDTWLVPTCSRDIPF
jgi:hypothetical protein